MSAALFGARHCIQDFPVRRTGALIALVTVESRR